MILLSYELWKEDLVKNRGKIKYIYDKISNASGSGDQTHGICFVHLPSPPVILYIVWKYPLPLFLQDINKNEYIFARHWIEYMFLYRILNFCQWKILKSRELVFNNTSLVLCILKESTKRNTHISKRKKIAYPKWIITFQIVRRKKSKNHSYYPNSLDSGESVPLW